MSDNINPTELPQTFTCPKCNPEYWGRCAKHECAYYEWCMDRWLDHLAVHAALKAMAGHGGAT